MMSTIKWRKQMRYIFFTLSMFLLFTSVSFADVKRDYVQYASNLTYSVEKVRYYDEYGRPVPPPPVYYDKYGRPVPPPRPAPSYNVEVRPAPPPPPKHHVDRRPAPPPSRPYVDRRPAPPAPTYNIEVRPAPPPPPKR